jgi:hypothetical protein
MQSTYAVNGVSCDAETAGFDSDFSQSLPVFRIAPDVVGSVLLGYIASPWIPFLIDVCKNNDNS